VTDTSRVIAVIDFGSNTLKLTVASVADDGTIETAIERSDTLRIGAGIEQTGRIDDERADRALAVLAKFQQLGEKAGAEAFIGVATEAFRVATNGQDVLDRIASETRWQIAVISGDEEARLTFLGLAQYLPEHGSAAIVDVGGGSTEWIKAVDRVQVHAQSIPVGSGRLADRFFSENPPTRESLDLAANSASAIFADSLARLDPRVDVLYLSGGNGQYLERLRAEYAIGEALSVGAITSVLERLTQEPAEQLAEMLDMQLERARVLPAGAAIAFAAAKISTPTVIGAIPSGIRLGLLRDYLAGNVARS